MLLFAPKSPKLKSAYSWSFFGGPWLWWSLFEELPGVWGCNKQITFWPKTHQNWNLLIRGPFFWTHCFDNPYLKKILGFGGVKSRLHFAPKPSKLKSAYSWSFFGGPWLWWSVFEEIPGVWGCNKQITFLPQNPQNWNLLIPGPFLGAHGFGDPYLRKFLGFGGVIGRLHFGPKPPKIEICLFEVLFWGPMALVILIWGNSWGLGV